MPHPIRFLFVLHDHQPVGNFDGVFEQAYQDSYRPFLDLFESYSDLKLALHTSGSLIEWLDAHHPEYLDRLSALVAAGRLEIIGGAFFEPILPMIPSRDRIGQIRSYREYLQHRLGAKVRGAWIPERVWEQSLAADISAAGTEYIILDDSHFKSASLDESQLFGYYLTEDAGRLLRVFPGSERLRYVIPFAAPHESIDYLRTIAERQSNAVAVFADDGEKFGSWPETKKPVFEEGWLRQFFDLLRANAEWIHLSTPSETIDTLPPLGKIYIPEGSYREMTEWVLPADQQTAYVRASSELQKQPQWPAVGRFARGGFWRNFLVRYPESGEMHARMMMVSRQLNELSKPSASGGGQGEGAESNQSLEQSTLAPVHSRRAQENGFSSNGHSAIDREQILRNARIELYRGQCNCPYWHGAFGGIYLPHLRNAIYQHLIAAENLLLEAAGRHEPWVEAESQDFNFDGRPDVKLSNDRLSLLMSPNRSGQIYELDVRSICHNLLATLSRRPEAYHQKVLAGPGGAGGSVIDANTPVKFKQAGLERHLQYDRYSRKSLLDHFYDDNVSPEAIVFNQAAERGDFLQGAYEARIRRSPDRVQVQLTRFGNAWGIPLRITKGVTLKAGSNMLEIAYLLEGLPRDRSLHFAVEFNFAGLPAGADDRYFHDHGNRLGQLGTQLNLTEVRNLNLCDQWLGIDAGLEFNRPTHIWTCPIETVSQSEGGFELVHQAVCVQPHWHVNGDADGRWAVVIQLTLDTSLAEQRQSQTRSAVVGSHV